MNWHRVALEAVEEYGAMQKVTELAALLELLAKRPIVNVLEIGSMYGGTLWALNHLATGRLVAVDLQVLEGRMESVDDLDYALVVADSTQPSTRDLVDRLMSHESPGFDLVLIDGDHRYDSVKADSANWWPLVAPDGLMVYHDICHRKLQDHDMWRFWQEERQSRAGYEIYDPQEPWGGLGVLQADPRGRWTDLHPLPRYACPAGRLEAPPQTLRLYDRRC